MEIRLQPLTGVFRLGKLVPATEKFVFAGLGSPGARDTDTGRSGRNIDGVAT